MGKAARHSRIVGECVAKEAIAFVNSNEERKGTGFQRLLNLQTSLRISLKCAHRLCAYLGRSPRSGLSIYLMREHLKTLSCENVTSTSPDLSHQVILIPRAYQNATNVSFSTSLPSWDARLDSMDCRYFNICATEPFDNTTTKSQHIQLDSPGTRPLHNPEGDLNQLQYFNVNMLSHPPPHLLFSPNSTATANPTTYAGVHTNSIQRTSITPSKPTSPAPP